MVTEIHSAQRKERRSTRRDNVASLKTRTANVVSLPVSQPVVRIAPGAEGVSIWSAALFGDPTGAYIREFLARVFRVTAVAAVEIRRAESFGRIYYSSTTNAQEIWRQLSDVLGREDGVTPALEPPVGQYADPKLVGVDSLYLDGPSALPIWVNRVGAALTTWRVRFQNDSRVRFTHPTLLNRGDVAHRVEEELATILGVEEYRTSTLTSSVAVRFNPRVLTVERLVCQLEKSWPRLLEGLDGPLSGTRLVIAGGLSGLAFTGQYLVPAVKPLALLGVAAYGLPNVVNGAKQLTQGQVGLPALYSVGLMFMLVSRMPFSAALMAALMQLWPRLAQQTMITGQRRLFATYRRRPTWARVVRGGGREHEIDLDVLKVGDVIAVREGEIIPADGVVTEGLAAVDEEALCGVVGAVDKSPGDAVYAASFVRDGRLTVRVEKLWIDTAAAAIAAHLPHTWIDHLSSSAEAERIANRNVKPALAVAGINLAVTRSLRQSQAVIRPDYATAPRLGAQLNALCGLGDGLRQGIVFRDPAALDRLASVEVYAFDDTAALERRQIEVGEVFTNGDISAATILGYVTAAFPDAQNERDHALRRHSPNQPVPIPAVFQHARRAGAVRYSDGDNRLLEIATPAYVTALGVTIPSSLAEAIAASSHTSPPLVDSGRSNVLAWEEPLLRPLWVLRDGEVLGVVTFRRQGVHEGLQVIAALKAHNKRAQFVYLSRGAQATAAVIAGLAGITIVFGDLDPEGKTRALRKLGGHTMWIGNGTLPESTPCIESSAVSLSVAGIATASVDEADVVFLRPGLRHLLPLARLGLGYHARMEADYRAVYTANLLGVTGGFLAGFGSLEAGLTSNIGTGYVYIRHWLQLRELIARTETSRALVGAPDAEALNNLADTVHAHS